jgi:hypothetical protein
MPIHIETGCYEWRDRDIVLSALEVFSQFTVIGRELHDPAILAENVYNTDETGILLSLQTSRKYVVHKDDLRNVQDLLSSVLW